MKEKIEDELETGLVNVIKSGNCSYLVWDVEWTSTGGLQPLMEVGTARMFSVDLLEVVDLFCC